MADLISVKLGLSAAPFAAHAIAAQTGQLRWSRWWMPLCAFGERARAACDQRQWLESRLRSPDLGQVRTAIERGLTPELIRVEARC
jgi:hypothetical protein